MNRHEKPRRLHDYYYRQRLEPDFFLCRLELRPVLFQILEGQGRAFLGVATLGLGG